jgi:hypothetical protein
MATSIHLDAREEPGFWYVLDCAIAHRHARSRGSGMVPAM